MGANVMLAIDEKKSTAVDLCCLLRQYITSAYSEREATTADGDICVVRDLRAAAVECPSLPDVSSLEERRDALLAYARALALVEPLFAMFPDTTRVHSLYFTWHDAFKTNKKVSQPSFHLERAAVLFNLGAVNSQIALACDLDTKIGIRIAILAFQIAAGAFGLLKKSGVADKAVAVGATTVDLTPDCAGMLEKLMLAQAQECFFKKVLDRWSKMKIGIPRMARQVGVFYEEAYAALCAPPLSEHIDKTWVSHVRLKAAQFYAEACYRCSLNLKQQQKTRRQIARLKTGVRTLADAKKAAKGVSTQLLAAVNELENNMKTNLDRAMKVKDGVYQIVKYAGTLQPLRATPLVKSASLTKDLDASKESLFASLVPDVSREAFFKYTKVIDGIIQIQVEKLQQTSETSRVWLKKMNLPDSIISLEGNISIPVDLKEDVEAVQISGGPAALETELQQLRDITSVSQNLLVQTEEMLQKVASKDAQFRSFWNRPQSTKKIQHRLNLHASFHMEAAGQNAVIEQALKNDFPLMYILEKRPIESALPSISRLITSLDGNEDAIVGALKQSLSQLQCLDKESAGLVDMLEEMKRTDDVLPKIVAGVGSHDVLKKEIAKYKPICAKIDDNIVVQEQLLLQIVAQYKQLSAVFNLDDFKVARKRCYKKIAAAVVTYQKIKMYINDCLQFYVVLQDHILRNLKASIGLHDLLKKEIAKYDPTYAEVADNIVAQEQLSLQTQAQNERFSAIYNLDNSRVACTLGALPSASLVKSSSLAQVRDASKQRCFSSIVSDGSMKIICEYAEKVNDSMEAGQISGGPPNMEMIRNVCRKLAGFNLSSITDQHCTSPTVHAQGDYMRCLIELATLSGPPSILDLPDDTLVLIADYLRSAHQVEMMRLVCPPWNHALPTRLGPFLAISLSEATLLDKVWLLQIQNDVAEDGQARLRMASCPGIIPPAGSVCWGSAHGMMAMACIPPNKANLFLYCLHCAEKQQLPPLMFDMSPRGVFFRAAPMHDHFLVALTSEAREGRLLNDMFDWNDDAEAGYKWSPYPGLEHKDVSSIAFLPSVLMGVVTTKGQLIVDEMWRPLTNIDGLITLDLPVRGGNFLVPWTNNHSHLFVCEEVIYLCLIFDIDDPSNLSLGDIPVRVQLYQLVNDRLHGYQLIPCSNIGPYSVFLGPNQAIVLPALENSLGRMRNTIYVEDWSKTIVREHRILAVNLSSQSVTYIEFPRFLAAEGNAMYRFKPAVWVCSPAEKDMFGICCCGKSGKSGKSGKPTL